MDLTVEDDHDLVITLFQNGLVQQCLRKVHEIFNMKFHKLDDFVIWVEKLENKCASCQSYRSTLF